MKKTNEQDKKTKNSIGSGAFKGNIRLQLESADNHIQVNRFCEYLKTYRNLQIVSYSWSEAKGLIITIALRDAAPLGDMLCGTPMVEQVYKRKKNVVVVLNTAPMETASPPATITPEESLAS